MLKKFLLLSLIVFLIVGSLSNVFANNLKSDKEVIDKMNKQIEIEKKQSKSIPSNGYNVNFTKK